MVTTTTGGGNTTVTIQYTATNTKVSNTLTDMAHELWSRGPKETTFESLTNSERLELIDAYILAHIRNLAKQYRRESSTAAAEATAETESTTLYM